MIKVVDVWKETSRESQWRVWKTLSRDLNLPIDCDREPWRELTSLRKIHLHEGRDILCWGHSTTDTFTIKEAYHIKAQFQLLPKDPIWHIIWKLNLWSKVSNFLWLMAQKLYPHLGQLKEKRFYNTLYLSSLYAAGEINGAPDELMSFQLGTLGRGGNHYEENESFNNQHYPIYRTLEKEFLQNSHYQ